MLSSEARGLVRRAYEDTFRENSTSLIDEIVAPLNVVKVPFSSSHGVSYTTRISGSMPTNTFFAES